MLRRCHTGSLENYGGTSYDFTTTPTQNNKILVEHINKLITPMSQVSFTDLNTQSVGDLVKSMTTLEATLLSYEDAPEVGEGHYCKDSCSGLCSTQCFSGCTGCGSGCATGCTSCTGCSGGCGDGCSGCGGTCTGSCSGSCSGNCSGCTGGCTGSPGGGWN